MSAIQGNSTSVEASIQRLPMRPNRNLDHLPGDYGAPIVGYTRELLNNAPALAERLYKRHGSVFRTSALLNRSVALIGPDAAAWILLDKERNIASQPAWNMVLGGLFDNGLLLRDFDNHRLHRRALQQAFKKPALEAYCARLNTLLQEGMQALPKGQYFDFYGAMKTLLLENACQLFLGAKPGGEIAELNKAFVDMVDATLVLVRRPLPGSKWRRGIAGRRVLESYLKGEIAKRRQTPGLDFFSTLCHADGEEGLKLSDQEIVDHTLFLLFAAHDTTSSTLSSIVRLLCKYPDWQGKLRCEVQGMGSEELKLADIPKLELCDHFFRETLRMHPPVPAVTRRVIRECEYQGYRIPANTSIFVSIRFLHYMEDYWEQPREFKPERWALEDAKSKMHSFQWLPFGGGAHKCLGMNLADIQSKLFLYHLLRQFSLDLQPGHRPKIQYVPMEVPANGLYARLTALD